MIETELYPYILAELPAEQWPIYKDQILNLVDRLHEAGIYHLDLHEENIVIDDNGTVKLIDFGLSRFVTELRDRELFDPGHIEQFYEEYSTVEDLARNDYNEIAIYLP